MLDVRSGSGSFSLGREELRAFHEQGYAGPYTLYEPDEIKALWRRERIRLMDRSMAVYQDVDAVSGVTNIANYDRHLDNEFLAQHIYRRQIVDRVCSILGPTSSAGGRNSFRSIPATRAPIGTKPTPLPTRRARRRSSGPNTGTSAER